MRVEVTKCFLVQVLDNEGNELACEYVFGDQDAVVNAGVRLMEEVEDNG